MKTKFHLLLLFLMSVALSGCITHSQGERRVVELPKGDPNTNIATAQKICGDLIADGFASDLHQKFPSLTQTQMQGVFLTPAEGTFQDGPSVFIMTGITYTDPLPDAKEIADYCESVVRKAVAAKFPQSVNPSPGK
jgi:hypothetical protein